MPRTNTNPSFNLAGAASRKSFASRSDQIVRALATSWRRGIRRALIAVGLLLLARCATTGPVMGKLSSSACTPPLAHAVAPAPDRGERRCLFLDNDRCNREAAAYLALHRAP